MLFSCSDGVIQNVNLDLIATDIIDKEYRTRIMGVTVDTVWFTYTRQESLTGCCKVELRKSHYYKTGGLLFSLDLAELPRM